MARGCGVLLLCILLFLAFLGLVVGGVALVGAESLPETVAMMDWLGSLPLHLWST